MRNFGAYALLMVAVAIAAFQFSGSTFAQQDDGGGKPKYSIKAVMEKAHKGGLLKKVLEGQANHEDKMALLDHYVSLSESKPPKGAAESWKEKTDAVIVAAAKVATDRDDGTELLKNVTNCAACHKEHKGK